MEKIIKLTQTGFDTDPEMILIGVDHIIKIDSKTLQRGGRYLTATRVESRGAMVTTSYVTESIEEIYNMIKS